LKEEFLDREVHKGASGGERKKMEIASLLALEPKVAFLDEIDSGLDIDAMKSIGASLCEFMAAGNRSVILVSHTDRFLKEVCPTHVHVLCSGTIVKSGGPELIDQVHKDGYCPFMDMCKK
jgi:Fe-S cluster assembly ATP-binding protein